MTTTKTSAAARKFPARGASPTGGGSPSSRTPRYAVGIVHYHTPEALERCLASVAAQRVPAHAVRVLDVEGGGRSLVAAHPEIDWREADNRGYAGASNDLVGWAAEGAVDFLLLLNADVVLDADFGAALLHHTVEHPEAGLATGKLLRADGQHIDSAGIVLPRNRRPRDRGSEELDRGQYEQVERVFGASGAAMWIRLAAAEDLALGGELFDESFFMYHEDTDVAWRAALLGWSCLYVPAARARHERGWQRDGRFEVPDEIRRHSFKNHYLQMIKNERATDWLRDLPIILGWEVLRLGFALLRDRAMLPAYLAAARLAPAAWRKRRALQARRAGRADTRVRFGS